jgi:hypothetical protein
VDIRLVSSFTDDDEDRFAGVLLNTMSDLLSQIPIVYSVRIETAGGKVLQHSRAETESAPDGGRHPRMPQSASARER